MKKLNKNFKLKILGSVMALLIAGYANSAQAADQLLAKTRLTIPLGQATAELWGDRISGGYGTDLLLLIKDEDGHILTAYNPSIKGGYGCTLRAVQVKGEPFNQQLLLGAAQGDWHANTEYRVIDVSDFKHVRELFTPVNSMGVVQTVKYADRTLNLDLLDSDSCSAALPEKAVAEESREVFYAGLSNLAAYDLDSDGTDELISNQKLVQNKSVLAEVGAVWKLAAEEKQTSAEVALADAEDEDSALAAVEDRLIMEPDAEKVDEALDELAEKETGLDAVASVVNESKEATEATVSETKAEEEKPEPIIPPAKWDKREFTVMVVEPVEKGNTVNSGVIFGKVQLLPRSLALPTGEACYPEAVSMEYSPVVEKINNILVEENSKLLQPFYDGKADMAYNVLNREPELLTIQYISGKETFHKHYVNIDTITGKRVLLKDIINVKNKKLMPKLRDLNKDDEKQLMLEVAPPAEWYLQGDKLILVEEQCGEEVRGTFNLNDLRDFVQKKPWLQRKLTDQSVSDKKSSKTEKTQEKQP